MGGITYYKTTWGEAVRELGEYFKSPPGADADGAIMQVDYFRDTMTLRNGKVIPRRATLAKDADSPYFVTVLDDWADYSGWKPPKSWLYVKHEE